MAAQLYLIESAGQNYFWIAIQKLGVYNQPGGGRPLGRAKELVVAIYSTEIDGPFDSSYQCV